MGRHRVASPTAQLAASTPHSSSLESPSTHSASTRPPASASSPPRASSPAVASARSLFPGDVLWLWRIVDEQCVKRKRFGQDVIPDHGAADRDLVEFNGEAAPGRELYGPESGVHLRGDGGDCTVYDCAWVSVSSVI